MKHIANIQVKIELDCDPIDAKRLAIIAADTIAHSMADEPIVQRTDMEGDSVTAEIVAAKFTKLDPAKEV